VLALFIALYLSDIIFFQNWSSNFILNGHFGSRFCFLLKARKEPTLLDPLYRDILTDWPSDRPSSEPCRDEFCVRLHGVTFWQAVACSRWFCRVSPSQLANNFNVLLTWLRPLYSSTQVEYRLGVLACLTAMTMMTITVTTVNVVTPKFYCQHTSYALRESPCGETQFVNDLRTVMSLLTEYDQFLRLVWWFSDSEIEWSGYFRMQTEVFEVMHS
jgi:hypothetical protein